MGDISVHKTDEPAMRDIYFSNSIISANHKGAASPMVSGGLRRKADDRLVSAAARKLAQEIHDKNEPRHVPRRSMRYSADA